MVSMFNKNPIIKGTIIITVASLLGKIIGFLYRIFLSNLIGAKGMGIFQLIFPVLAFFVALSCGGIQLAVSRFVAESKNKKESFLVLLSSLIMSLFFSVIALGILYCFAGSISNLIIKNDACKELLKYAAFSIPPATIHACICGYYLGLKKTFVPAWSGVFEQLIKVLALFILWNVWSQNNIAITPLIAVYSMIISEFFGMVFCMIAICGEKFFRINLRNFFRTSKKIFSVSYILTLNKIMLSFLQTIEAVIFPGALLKSGLSKSEALSIYGILTGMAMPVITFPSAINTSVSTMLLPTIASANTKNNNDSIIKTTEYSIWFSMMTGIFCTGIFIFYGDFIGTKFFGQYIAGQYIIALSFLCPFMYMSITMGSILHGLALTNAAFIHNVIGVVIRLISIWFGVPIWGMQGFFIGLLISNLVITLLHCYYIHKQIKFTFSAVDNIIKPLFWLIISLLFGKLIAYILSFSRCSGFGFELFSSIISGICIILVYGYYVLKCIKDFKKI